MTDSTFNSQRRYDAPFGQPQPAQTYPQFGTPTPADNSNLFTDSAHQPLMQEHHQHDGDPRPANFPPCKPCIHHNISTDIANHDQKIVKQAYFGWYMHSLALFWNWICCFGYLVRGAAITAFVYGSVALVLGIPISFWVYWLLYSGVRKHSSFNFVLWFIVYVLQIASEIFFAIGLAGYGTAGFISMIEVFGAKEMVLGIFFAVSLFLWVAVILYNVSFFYRAKVFYNTLGGNDAAKKEFGQIAVQTAYDNRETIVQVAKDNKETIKQVAIENKDVIVDFAKDNRQVIVQAAISRPDVVYENRDTVAAVFSKGSSSNV